MKRLTALILLAVFGLGIAPLARAQSDNDGARLAAQKHNARKSQQQIKARDKAIRKSQKAMAKRARSQRIRQKHSGTSPY